MAAGTAAGRCVHLRLCGKRANAARCCATPPFSPRGRPQHSRARAPTAQRQQAGSARGGGAETGKKASSRGAKHMKNGLGWGPRRRDPAGGTRKKVLTDWTGGQPPQGCTLAPLCPPTNQQDHSQHRALDPTPPQPTHGRPPPAGLQTARGRGAHRGGHGNKTLKAGQLGAARTKPPKNWAASCRRGPAHPHAPCRHHHHHTNHRTHASRHPPPAPPPCPTGCGAHTVPRGGGKGIISPSPLGRDGQRRGLSS